MEGYLTAERRGIACLLKEYQDVVMRHIKHRRRQVSCAAGAMLTTGEDVDLDNRYEQMRMSPLLIEATQHLTYEGMCSPNAIGTNFAVLSRLICVAMLLWCRRLPQPERTDMLSFLPIRNFWGLRVHIWRPQGRLQRARLLKRA